MCMEKVAQITYEDVEELPLVTSYKCSDDEYICVENNPLTEWATYRLCNKLLPTKITLVVPVGHTITNTHFLKFAIDGYNLWTVQIGKDNGAGKLLLINSQIDYLKKEFNTGAGNSVSFPHEKSIIWVTLSKAKNSFNKNDLLLLDTTMRTPEGYLETRCTYKQDPLEFLHATTQGKFVKEVE